MQESICTSSPWTRHCTGGNLFWMSMHLWQAGGWKSMTKSLCYTVWIWRRLKSQGSQKKTDSSSLKVSYVELCLVQSCSMKRKAALQVIFSGHQRAKCDDTFFFLMSVEFAMFFHIPHMGWSQEAFFPGSATFIFKLDAAFGCYWMYCFILFGQGITILRFSVSILLVILHIVGNIMGSGAFSSSSGVFFFSPLEDWMMTKHLLSETSA